MKQIQLSSLLFTLLMATSTLASAQTDWNQQSEESARQTAMVACNSVMGGGCTIALNAWNSAIAIARSQDDFFMDRLGGHARLGPQTSHIRTE